MPKIYKGEVILRLTAKELTAKELINIIGNLNGEKLKIILPKTHHSVTALKLNALRDSTDKLQLIIEAKDPAAIPDAASEVVDYIKNSPLIKRYVEQEKERLSKQLEELSKNIESSKELIQTYETLLKREKLIPIGFNPADLMRSISHLQIEKIQVEHAIKNLKGVEVLVQYIYNKPVKPNIKKNIVLAGIVSLVAGIFLAFFVEYIKRVNKH